MMEAGLIPASQEDGDDKTVGGSTAVRNRKKDKKKPAA